MTHGNLRIIVCGTAGGVGTTTLTAILFDQLSRLSPSVPAIADHSSGSVGARLPRGDDAATIDTGLVLHDLGPHALGEGLDLLESPSIIAVIATANTPLGFAAADELLSAVRERYGQAGLARVTVVAMGTRGRFRTKRLTESLHLTYGRGIASVIRHDAALAGGGRIPVHRLAKRTVTACDLLGRRVLASAAHHRR
ncbi:hypothetical protein K2F54_13100 [Cryobacterium sp. 1639]|uniref:hypothetical protein n=1 Tax=Cryobacterium inferilacus TaxID=2866629 RepID=UPI001C72F3D2|nr:hypothetical protein [Cryobacterium sp. 1639]MBX0300913.1 hypothetical protein [Cryobacterium sp. 1639]